MYDGVFDSPGKVVADGDEAAAADTAAESGSTLIRITVSRCAGCGLSTPLVIVRGTYLSNFEKGFDSIAKGEEVDGEMDSSGEVNEEPDERIEGTRD